VFLAITGHAAEEALESDDTAELAGARRAQRKSA
jgi:hypothetical protein